MATNIILKETSIDTNEIIIEGDDSRQVYTEVFDAVDEVTPVTITAVHVYITERRTGATINNRDGTTNVSGISFTDNKITFLIDALDNVRVTTSDYEHHWITIKAHFGARSGIMRRSFKIIKQT